MSNASLKEQLQAVASKLSDGQPATSKASTTVAAPASGENKVNRERVAAKNRGSETRMKQQRPAVVEKKPKPKWLDYVQYGVELLKAYFPAAFKNANEIKPLKKGIKQDLVLKLSTIETIVTEDKACMVKSLAYYVNMSAYHKVVLEGATRIDLEGAAAGTVSAEEAKYSQERFQEKQQTRQNHKRS